MAEQTNESQVRTFLQPIAAPSILGLYGFAGSTLILASHTAKLWGDPTDTVFIWPFAAMFGGVAQFAAGMWAYKARDGLATGMHGMWGAFWIGWGILELLFVTGTVPKPEGAFPAFAMWFVALAWITFVGAIAASFENTALAITLHTLWIASAVLAVGEFIASDPLKILAGWVFIASAVAAWYTGSALLLEGILGRAVLPVGMTKMAQQEPSLAPGEGEPGVAKGQ